MAQYGDSKGEFRGLIHRNDADLAAWLSSKPAEAALEPDLPIIDPHHHFWDTPARGEYFLPDLLKDIGGGHNVVATVFLECHAMYRKHGPVEMAPVGEVAFVNGIAAMSASGNYGPCRVAEGIVGWADVTLGARVREVLEAEIVAGGGRFRGIRYGVAWDGSDAVGKFASRIVPPHLARDATFREGIAQLAKLNLSFESWQIACAELGVELPWTTRRANILVSGMKFSAEDVGKILQIGDVQLQITVETDPCNRMDEQHQGLTVALTPDWRAGVCCRVLQGGEIRLNDHVAMID